MTKREIQQLLDRKIHERNVRRQALHLTVELENVFLSQMSRRELEERRDFLLDEINRLDAEIKHLTNLSND